MLAIWWVRTANSYSFRWCLYPYTRNNQIWKCPPNLTTYTDQGYFDSTTGKISPGTLISTNYSLNDAGGNNFGQFNGQYPALSSITTPADKILVLETRNTNWDDYASPWWCGQGGADGAPNGHFAFDGFLGHSRGWNLSFADSHAKFSRATSLSRG